MSHYKTQFGKRIYFINNADVIIKDVVTYSEILYVTFRPSNLTTSVDKDVIMLEV